MWLKDSRGNWFLAGQIAIGCCVEPTGRWIKTPDNEWLLHDDKPLMGDTVFAHLDTWAS